ncbi:MAG TPA: alpha/beta hydrolase [Gemmatimonadaceae bacterium]|nr:alpha/beta hydrolase [Gemmatimonadaceae bacterium]
MIVFIHGLLQVPTPHVVAASLPAGETLAPDLPGYGTHVDARDVSLDAAVNQVARVIRAAGAPAHVAGHSVGGAAAMLLAYRHPELVRSVISIEGNFMPADAFWSRSIAGQSETEVEHWLAEQRRDPARWLAAQGIVATPERVVRTAEGLAAQPATSIRAMARSVVRHTFAPEYLQMVQQIISRGTPIHLIAGERSVAGWDVPSWVRDAAASERLVPGVGHLVWLEDAHAAGAAVVAAAALTDARATA